MEEKKFVVQIRLWDKFFNNLNKDIDNYERYCWNEGTTKERLEIKREKLLKVATEATCLDLMVLYYLRSGYSCDIRKVYKSLRKLYRVTQEMENLLNGKEAVWDIEEIGEKLKKSQKNP